MEPKKVTISGLPLHGNAFGWGEAIQIDMRILLAIAPTMYRQTLAHSIRRECPNDDVCLADPDALDREASSFHPHMIVCNDSASEVQEVSIPSWVVIRYHDSLSASVFLDGEDPRLIQDISIEDLLGVVEETQRLVVRGS
ncbi:MAG TPA: hypothetical protein VI027_07375 [Rubrobacteraceae bacterium]|jgi:hypothetical protein